eukprot:TRINITY_DN777819_c0_g1_i1.p1 TRINITY_DN777819_c0_g1~~TRINITY_DN777819_c0_g1_i1.p1  ORF type:complete len:849 (+),score=256.99 TRINITY_DN777819_c0_g1_i1:170-2716(+)
MADSVTVPFEGHWVACNGKPATKFNAEVSIRVLENENGELYRVVIELYDIPSIEGNSMFWHYVAVIEKGFRLITHESKGANVVEVASFTNSLVSAISDSEIQLEKGDSNQVILHIHHTEATRTGITFIECGRHYKELLEQINDEKEEAVARSNFLEIELDECEKTNGKPVSECRKSVKNMLNDLVASLAEDTNSNNGQINDGIKPSESNALIVKNESAANLAWLASVNIGQLVDVLDARNLLQRSGQLKKKCWMLGKVVCIREDKLLIKPIGWSLEAACWIPRLSRYIIPPFTKVFCFHRSIEMGQRVGFLPHYGLGYPGSWISGIVEKDLSARGALEIACHDLNGKLILRERVSRDDERIVPEEWISLSETKFKRMLLGEGKEEKSFKRILGITGGYHSDGPVRSRSSHSGDEAYDETDNSKRKSRRRMRSSDLSESRSPSPDYEPAPAPKRRRPQTSTTNSGTTSKKPLRYHRVIENSNTARNEIINNDDTPLHVQFSRLSTVETLYRMLALLKEHDPNVLTQTGRQLLETTEQVIGKDAVGVIIPQDTQSSNRARCLKRCLHAAEEFKDLILIGSARNPFGKVMEALSIWSLSESLFTSWIENRSWETDVYKKYTRGVLLLFHDYYSKGKVKETMCRGTTVHRILGSHWFVEALIEEIENVLNEDPPDDEDIIPTHDELVDWTANILDMMFVRVLLEKNLGNKHNPYMLNLTDAMVRLAKPICSRPLASRTKVFAWMADQDAMRIQLVRDLTRYRTGKFVIPLARYLTHMWGGDWEGELPERDLSQRETPAFCDLIEKKRLQEESEEDDKEDEANESEDIDENEDDCDSVEQITPTNEDLSMVAI